jgi:hypothetical protein
LSGKADDGWLATALSEMLSTELAAGEKLRLVSSEDVANLRLSSPWPSHDTLDQKTTSRIGSALNSDLLVLGSYATVGRPDREQLRIDVRLQAARTGEILSEIAEIGSRQDLLQLVSGIGEKLRSRLGVPQLDQPDQVSVAASLPSNRDAARLYALGVVKLREFDALAARDLLQQTCHADPKFALGHAMLARAWNQLGYEQKGKDEAKKALDLSVNRQLGLLIIVNCPHLGHVDAWVVGGGSRQSSKPGDRFDSLVCVTSCVLRYGKQKAILNVIRE